jgi:hypothetical protein
LDRLRIKIHTGRTKDGIVKIQLYKYKENMVKKKAWVFKSDWPQDMQITIA